MAICPATSNLPTRMSEQSWDALCKATRKSRTTWNDVSMGADVGSLSRRLNHCAECQGRMLPPGLELIDLTQGEEEMAANSRKGTCGCCGAKGLMVSKSYKSLDKEICSTCAGIHASVNQRPGAVAMAIINMGKQQEIVGLLGCAGSAVAIAPPYVIKALGCADDQWEKAAVQTAALLEDCERDLDVERVRCLRNNAAFSELQDEVSRIYEAIGLGEDEPFDEIVKTIGILTEALGQYKQQVDRLAGESTSLANQVADLEQRNAVYAQVFAMISEALDCPGCLPEELPSRLEALLANHAGLIIPTVASATASPLDSHLLDLMLDYPGIPLERIAAIREAA